MAFDQGGARGFATKKALKDAARDGRPISLYSTSLFGSPFYGDASELPDGLTFNVVGPDPYTRRNWYASVSRKSDGKVTVR